MSIQCVYKLLYPTTEYEPGTVYEYQYESQVMTGLPTFSKQYAGIKIRCDLMIG